MGSTFIKLLLKETKHSVVNLDKVTYAANFDNLKEVAKSNRYKFVKGDIADKKMVSIKMSDEAVVDSTSLFQTDLSAIRVLERIAFNVGTPEAYAAIKIAAS